MTVSNRNRMRLRKFASARTALLLAILLMLGLRLDFIYRVSTIEVIWDAEGYYNAAITLRDDICARVKFCEPGLDENFYNDHIGSVLFTRNGLLPAISGLVMAFTGPDVTAILVLFVAMDLMICLMLASMIQQLRLSPWLAVLTILLYAVYVPAITGDGAILQQPLIRMGLVLTIWAYVSALTTPNLRYAARLLMLGMLGALVVGFASITTRPLLWLLSGGVFLFLRRKPSLVRLQLVLIGAVLGIFILFAALAPLRGRDESATNLLSALVTGISPSDRIVSTNLFSYRTFWASSAWTNQIDVQLVEILREEPLRLVLWWGNSIFSNWRFPDYPYLQVYLLSLYGQQVQHMLYLVGSMVGLLWLLGQRGIRQSLAVMIGIAVGFLSVAYGVISVEPRRLAVLSPFMALGAALAVFLCAGALRRLLRQPVWAGIGLLGFTVLVWIITPAWLLILLPVPTITVHAGLVIVRLLLTAALGAYVLYQWKRHVPDYYVALPALAGSAILLILAIGLVQDKEWRIWQAELRADTTARQEITDMAVDPQLSTWLVMDIDPADAALSITVNGSSVWISGNPLYTWEAGITPTWEMYTLLTQMANVPPTRHLWHAIPLPEAVVVADMTIDVTVTNGAMQLVGDYQEGDTYTGPLLDPWYTGHSFWRWQWNGDDPRIPWEQPLNGQYRSVRQMSDLSQSADLSLAPGVQTGLWRMFVVQTPFDTRTNAFEMPTLEALETPELPVCPGGSLLAGSAGTPYLCLLEDETLFIYTAAGDWLGEEQTELFKRTYRSRYQRLAQGESEVGSYQVLTLVPNQFLITIYTPENERVYSLVFRIP